ncbi:MAG TPA: hypothetical protein VN816_08665 [Acidimicrobiales bacterium]|nr:hypothetical protein [Acidimicrobiales bacterium]
MTMESRQPEGAESNSNLVRPAALSSADLWHEIIERLNEVQEGQLRLARAIESLGVIVCDALSVNPQAALGGAEVATLPRSAQRVPLAAGPPAQPPVADLGTNTDDAATTQRKLDSLLDADVFAPASPAPDLATTGPVGSPRFYVAPVPDESRKTPRESVSTGSWPRGRRVARGLAREAPTMNSPAVVPDLTPAAIDALLAAEFGDTPSGPTPPLRVVQASEGSAALNSLLGAEFGASTPTKTPSQAPTASQAPMASQAPTSTPVRPSPSVRPTAPPAPPAPRPPSPVAASPTTAPTVPMPPQPRPRQAVPTPPPGAPTSPPPMTAPRTASPMVDPRRSVGSLPPVPAPPPPPAAVAPPPPPPPPSPVPPPPPGPRPSAVAGPVPLRPPLATSPGPPPAPAASPGPPPGRSIPAPSVDPSTGAVPTVSAGSLGAPAPVEPRRAPLGPVTGTPAPFVSPGSPAPEGTPPFTPGSADATAPFEAGADRIPQPTKARESAASMVTEILSAAPPTTAAEPTDDAPAMLAEDVTIMAKGRRRRFRLPLSGR